MGSHFHCRRAAPVTPPTQLHAAPAAVVTAAAAAVPQASKLRRTVQDADRRKQQRRIAHSAPGTVKVKPERKKKIVAEVE